MNIQSLIKSEQIKKSDITKLANEIINSANPLQDYIVTKALEILTKEILDNKEFRRKVKDNYLTLSEGSLSKSHLLGVTVKTVSLEKKNELVKNYEFTKEVTNLEKKINKAEIELKSMKTRLKEYKLLEINKGLATEISTAEITGEVAEVNPLDQFNITITFD